MALFVDGSCESIGRDVARGVSAVLAVAGALPDELGLREELASVAAAVARGYFLPDEDALVRRRYVGYLSLRAALLETLGDLAAMAGRGRIQWQQRLPVFTTAFAAACVLMRANRFVIDLAGDKPLLWKKLDEADVVAGIPRKTFTTIYRAATSPANLRRFLAASDFYFANRESIRELAAASFGLATGDVRNLRGLGAGDLRAAPARGEAWRCAQADHRGDADGGGGPSEARRCGCDPP